MNGQSAGGKLVSMAGLAAADRLKLVLIGGVVRPDNSVTHPAQPTTVNRAA